MIAIVDAGPLYAAVNTHDRDHDRCVELLERRDLDLVVPALVVAEVCYFVGKNFGGHTEAAFLRGLEAMNVEAPMKEDWPMIANLVERYSDFPLGGPDASVAVLADRLGTDLIVTLDRGHFAALRTSTGRPFTLLPD